VNTQMLMRHSLTSRRVARSRKVVDAVRASRGSTHRRFRRRRSERERETRVRNGAGSSDFQPNPFTMGWLWGAKESVVDAQELVKPTRHTTPAGTVFGVGAIGGGEKSAGDQGV
jgi:hypothetical protein